MYWFHNQTKKSILIFLISKPFYSPQQWQHWLLTKCSNNHRLKLPQECIYPHSFIYSKDLTDLVCLHIRHYAVCYEVQEAHSALKSRHWSREDTQKCTTPFGKCYETICHGSTEAGHSTQPGGVRWRFSRHFPSRSENIFPKNKESTLELHIPPWSYTFLFPHICHMRTHHLLQSSK